LADLEKLIHNEPELAQSDHGKVAWKGDALHTILGEEKPGQVHGMGLLPVPSQVYGRIPRYLKNINMTTTTGSSHDGDGDVMEEIAKLKRRIEEQDQRIEEQDQIIEGFRNKDEVCGLNEIAMIILFWAIHICNVLKYFINPVGQYPTM
jgi:hypothetical protein